MASPVLLDSAGVRAHLNSPEVAAEVRAAAEKVAANVNAQGLTASSGAAKSGSAITAVVWSYTTDRAAAAVSIQHPAGLAMQAKHGVLTKAATAAGLEVKMK